MRPEKVFRVDEANAFVPRLESLVSRLQRGALQLQDEMVRLATDAGVAVADLTAEDLVRRVPAARTLIEELDGIVREIEASGAHLKDVKLGLVDFPTEREGEIVYLCWQSGEPEVAFWHRTDEGFAGRQPLPGSTRTPYLQ